MENEPARVRRKKSVQARLDLGEHVEHGARHHHVEAVQRTGLEHVELHEPPPGPTLARHRQDLSRVVGADVVEPAGPPALEQFAVRADARSRCRGSGPGEAAPALRRAA